MNINEIRKTDPLYGMAETRKLDEIFKLLNERLKPAEDQEYLLGVSYKEALGAVTRSVNGLYSIIEALQNRVLELELKDDIREATK